MSARSPRGSLAASAEYGTRCSTVFALERDGSAQLTERSFDAAGNMTGETAYAFTVAAVADQRA